MTPDERLDACVDPSVRAVRAQAFALHLLARGLRPKQVAIATGITLWKANHLRRGLWPDDRPGGSPMSAATILRRPWRRIASSIIVDLYQRLASTPEAADADWHLFLESYDTYRLVVGHGAPTPMLPIEDAATVFVALTNNLIAQRKCALHGSRYLVIPETARPWSCPYCSFDAGEWVMPESADDDDGAADFDSWHEPLGTAGSQLPLSMLLSA